MAAKTFLDKQNYFLIEQQILFQDYFLTFLFSKTKCFIKSQSGKGLKNSMKYVLNISMERFFIKTFAQLEAFKLQKILQQKLQQISSISIKVKKKGISMLIRSQLESKSQERKKLSINSSHSNSSKSNLKISTNIQQRHRSSFFKPAETKIDTHNDEKDKQEVKQLSGNKKDNFLIKRVNYHNKSQQRCQGPRILKPSLKHNSNENTLRNFPTMDSKNHKDEQPKTNLGFKKNPLNNRLVLSHLMNSSSSKGEDFKNVIEEPSVKELQPLRMTNGRRAGTNKKCNTVYIERAQNQLLQLGDSINKSRSINCSSLFQTTLLNRKNAKNLSYEFLNVQVTIPPHSKCEMHDVQIQAIQQQREYFDYLRYKRRKQEFQNELQNLFTEISIVKDDRAIYETRIEKLKSCESQEPKNQRQQRVFKIKDEIAKQQKKIESIFLQKLSTLQKYLSQLSKLDRILSIDSERFLQSFNSIFKVKQCDENKLNISGNIEATQHEKMENYFRNFLKQIIKKVQMLISRNKPSKQELIELISAHDEYKKTIHEQKCLLRNCFGHIKKIPQLCYGLCGNELPNTQPKNQFRNDNNEFSMPKCMDCFNSEWKLHLIIEKNISMQSIFKVTQQLLK